MQKNDCEWYSIKYKHISLYLNTVLEQLHLVIFHQLGWYSSAQFQVWSPKHLSLPLLSPGRGSTRPEVLCWSVSIATTQSARRASTSATRAPSSRRAFTPGNDLTRSPRPLTSVQPPATVTLTFTMATRKVQYSPSSSLLGPDRQTRTFVWTSASRGRKTTLLTWTLVSVRGSTQVIAPWEETGKNNMAAISVEEIHYCTSSYPQCGYSQESKTHKHKIHIQNYKLRMLEELNEILPKRKCIQHRSFFSLNCATYCDQTAAHCHRNWEETLNRHFYCLWCLGTGLFNPAQNGCRWFYFMSYCKTHCVYCMCVCVYREKKNKTKGWSPSFDLFFLLKG